MGLIFANDVENISITGEGVLDGRITSKTKKNKLITKEERKYMRSKRKIS